MRSNRTNQTQRPVGPSEGSATEPPDEAKLKKPLALVVDDDEEFVELLCLMLQADFEIVTAFNGSDALSKFETIAPDLVITDIIMPRLDGFVLISELRRLTDKPILAISGGISEASRKVLAGFNTEFVGKQKIADELLTRSLELVKSYQNRLGKPANTQRAS